MPTRIAFLDAPHAVRIDAEARLGKRRADRAEHLDVVVGREEPAFQLVRLEAVAVDEVAGMRHHLLGGRLAALAGRLVAVAVEEVARERHLLAQRPAEQVAGADAQVFAGDVHAGELERGVELIAVVVERGHRIHDLPAELLELQRVVADEVLLEAPDRHLGRFAAAAHLAEPGQALVGLDLDDGAHEAAPMRAVRMAERRLERDRDRGGAEIGDLHLVPALGEEFG